MAYYLIQESEELTHYSVFQGHYRTKDGIKEATIDNGVYYSADGVWSASKIWIDNPFVRISKKEYDVLKSESEKIDKQMRLWENSARALFF